MTDFDYEVMEKRSVARSAKYKINGCKSRKCTLATDYMTPSQIKKMNGETVSYNINRPMTLQEFKKIPPEAGREYIVRLAHLYACNYTSLANMFGCGRSTCQRLLSSDPYNIVFTVGHSMSGQKKALWETFLNSAQTEVAPTPCEKAAEEIAEPEREPASEPAEVPAKEVVAETGAPAHMKMDKFSLSFSGFLSAAAIANSLRLVLGEGMEGTLVIEGHLSGAADD